MRYFPAEKAGLNIMPPSHPNENLKPDPENVAGTIAKISERDRERLDGLQGRFSASVYKMSELKTKTTLIFSRQSIALVKRQARQKALTGSFDPSNGSDWAQVGLPHRSQIGEKRIVVIPTIAE
jgi:hypothetical protein